MDSIKNLSPKNVWGCFYELTQIPRPSKKEAKAVEFLMDFGRKLGLETIKDKTGNIIIKKPAVPGMEDKKTVCLQAHIDMVPQKNSDKDHDFEKDPVETLIDGEWVTANGTTLGADNGIGLAAAMAVLKSEDLKHGPVEALFTVDEETGMTGAFGLESGMLDADILMNLDSEDEGELYIGCAGGVDANISMSVNFEACNDSYKAHHVFVKGLKGGHSGMDINLGRGNSIKILARFIYEAEKFGVRVSDFKGGSLRNAIPREAEALIAIPKKHNEEFIKFADGFLSTVKSELKSTEPDLEIIISEADAKVILDDKSQRNIIKSIYACPNGVFRMSDDMEGLVETSSNLAIAEIKEQKEFTASILIRSSVETGKQDLAQMIRNCFELAGAKVENDGDYPGWKPDVNSDILEVMRTVYNDKYGKVPDIKAVHAGLECGLFSKRYPDMDMISFGPTIRHPHSPDEKVDIKSVGKFWDYLILTLENIKSK